MLFKPEEKQSESNSLAMKKGQLSQSGCQWRSVILPSYPPLMSPSRLKYTTCLQTFFFFRRLTNQITLLLDCKIRDISHL